MDDAGHTLTDFLQHSGRLLPEVERGGVVLRRRDGQDLMLMTRGQSQALGDAVRVLAGAVLALLDRDATASVTTATSQRVLSLFPWMEYLSPGDRTACVKEIGEVASAAVATGRTDRLEELLAEWRASGLAAWDEKRLRERDDRDEYQLDEPVELSRPTG